MKVIEPWIEISKINGKEIMKNIEKACRTCYRSENLTGEETYKKLLENCITRGHESILEHEKITIRMCCDIGVYKDLTRHRFGSFSIESTRYCNYSKDKFDNNIKFIKPVFYKESWKDKTYEEYITDKEEQQSMIWYNCMQDIEETYLKMSKLDSKPDEMRMILPHSTAAEVVMTANIREWKHILSLRTTKMAHPSVQQLMIPLLLYFQEEMPEIFGKIEYNKDFEKEKYAKIIKV